MSCPMLRLIRIVFSAYLICAGLIVIVKLVYFSTPWTDPELFERLIIHPAAGMLMVFPGQRKEVRPWASYWYSR